jgi:hypothetical protein
MFTGNKTATEPELIEFLTTHVHRDGDCLVWAGALDKGRPTTHWRGRQYYAVRLLAKLTGRLAWDAPKTRVVYHKCDNGPTCMNPEHLVVGPHRDAARRAARERNAYARGVPTTSIQRSLTRGRNGAKISIADRPEILRMRAEGSTLAEIAHRYDTTFSNVSQRIRRWRYILGEQNE